MTRRWVWAAVAVLALALTGCTAGAPDGTKTSTPTPTPAVACIHGTWDAGGAALQPVYDAIPYQLDYPAATIDPAASVTVSFAADGTFTFTQDVPVTLTWLGHPAAIELGGEMSGTYTTTGESISLNADSNTLTATAADDRTASALFAAPTQETLTEWPVAASSFQCSGDELVLDLDTEGHAASVEFARVP